VDRRDRVHVDLRRVDPLYGIIVCVLWEFCEFFSDYIDFPALDFKFLMVIIGENLLNKAFGDVNQVADNNFRRRNVNGDDKKTTSWLTISFHAIPDKDR
jgi:hypothetical protein